LPGPVKDNTSPEPAETFLYLEALNVIREDNVSEKQIPLSLKNGLNSYTDLLDQHRYLDYSRIMVDAVAALLDSSDPTNTLLQQMIGDRIKYLFVVPVTGVSGSDNGRYVTIMAILSHT
jgi:hypothetical protein